MGSDGLVRRASIAPGTMDGSVVVHDRADDPAPVPGVGTTRRTVLTRGLAVAAGAIGASVVGTGAVLGAIPVTDASTLTLFVRDVRFRASGARTGALHEAHVPASPHGSLVDATGQAVGSFTAGVLTGSGGGIAVQRFTLANGTILGMGSGQSPGCRVRDRRRHGPLRGGPRHLHHPADLGRARQGCGIRDQPDGHEGVVRWQWTCSSSSMASTGKARTRSIKARSRSSRSAGV